MRNQYQEQIQTSRSLKRRSRSYVFQRPISEAAEGQWKTCLPSQPPFCFLATSSDESTPNSPSFPSSQARCRFSSPPSGQQSGLVAGERSGKGQRGWEQLGHPALPSFKMAAQSSAWSRQAVRVLSPQSPASRSWGRVYGGEGYACRAVGPEVLRSVAAATCTIIVTPRLWKGRWSR